MEPPNATWFPALAPSGILTWDGKLQVACATLGLPANAVALWLTGWHLKGKGLAAFILSLAASDFLFLANSILQILTVAHRHLWLFGVHLCHLHQFLYCVSYYSGLFLLATISLDRCLLVAVPLWYRCHRPKRLPVALCAGAWLAAVCCSIPEGVWSSVQEISPGLEICRTERGSWDVPMRWFEVLVEGLLPFVVVVTCHGAALVLAWCRRGQGGRPPARFQRIVAATLSLYVLLHLPFQVVQLLEQVQPDVSTHFLYFLGLAFNLSSCLNPYLYLLLGTRACHRLARPLRAVFARPAPAVHAPVPPTALDPVPPADIVTPVPPADIVTPVPPAAVSPVPPNTLAHVPPAALAPAPLPSPRCQ